MKCIISCLAVCFVFVVSDTAQAVTNLLTNPGFFDLVPGGGGAPGTDYGDGWSQFGATSFNQFFGPGNPHASIFADDAFNTGSFWQEGIAATPGKAYQFDLINTRIEANWDADLTFGVEFYAADGISFLGATKVPVDTAARLALPNVDTGGGVNGAVFSMQAVAPASAAFARPIAEFSNVNSAYVGGTTQQANSFVFNSFFSEVPAAGGELLKNPGFEDEDDDVVENFGDYWGSFGAAGFDNFFAGVGPANGHASLYADLPSNEGSIYQQSILGTAGNTYQFSLNDVRIESNFDATLKFGLEFYGDDDFTKISETIETIDTNTGMVDSNVFVMSGTAPAGTVYVRPVVSYDNVLSTATTDEGVFIFDASLVEVTASTEDADFDGDGDVDGKDFLTWQRGFGIGNLPSQGDANNSGTVDGVDLSIWQTQYGGGGPPVVGAVTVPEPTTLSIGLMAGIITMVLRRRG